MRLSKKHVAQGQALVEFALVAPWLFLMLFGIIEGGRFIFYYEMLNNATREGARYAIVHGGNAPSPRSGPPASGTTTNDPTGINVMDAARNAAIGLVDAGDLSADLPVWWDCEGTPPARGDASTGNNGRGQCVTVFLEYQYNTIIPLLPPITISAESTNVVNN